MLEDICPGREINDRIWWISTQFFTQIIVDHILDDFLSRFTDPRWQYLTNIIYAAILIYICAILVFLNDVAYLYFYVAFYRYIYIQESMLRKSARRILIYGSLLTPGGQCLHIPILVWLFVYILSFSGSSLLALKIAFQNITVVLASIFRTCLR